MTEQSSFQEIFPSNPAQWPYGTGQKSLAAQIRKNRASADNVLFFDRLLSDVGQIPDGTIPRGTWLIVGYKLYPPKNREELRRLHEKIEESETDSLKKSCLYYYLLKDFKADAKFAIDVAIPEQFCQLISGFYAFDHLQFEEAVQCFSYPQVVPGYTEKILGLLLKHSEYPNTAQLAVFFIEATKPPLDNSEKMSLYMEALIQTDLDAAFKYQRTAPEAIRKELFTNLITTAMNDPPPRTKLHRLFSFPFTSVETDMFVEHMKSAGTDGFGRDMLLMWNIQTANFSEAREIVLTDGGHSDEKRRVIREGLEKAKSHRII